MLLTPNTNQATGRKGEDLAAAFLTKQGYKIIERNFKKPQGDIDIVAIDGDTLVFIEVKTRYSKSYGLAVEAVTPWKIRALIKNAQLYKMLHPDYPDALRIDVVSVDYTKEPKPVIEVIKNITM